jgi:hypothetical protein
MDGEIELDIEEYSNTDRTMILSGEVPSDPPTTVYSKITWTGLHADGFYTCELATDVASLAAARAEPNDAVTTTPAASGCNGGPWLRFQPLFELGGVWTDGAATFEIFQDYWDDQLIVEYSNSANEAFTQNSNDASPTANLFNKVVWTEPTSGGFAYCEVSQDEATLELAESEASDANPFNLETGCNGGAWTGLTPQIIEARVGR